MIDTRNWREFKISDIFITNKRGKVLKVPTGATVSKNKLKDGTIPRVTVSNFNNGITGYYANSDDKDYRVYNNFISVSFLGTVFYQPGITSLDMKVHCLKPLEYVLNEYSAGYIVSVIRKAIMNFAYSDQLSSEVLAKLRISLPITLDGQPDWAYMESYMKKIMEKSEKSLKNLKKSNCCNHLIDTRSWGKFCVRDFFKVLKGRSKLSITDINDGNVPVYSSNSKGGIFGYTTKQPDYLITKDTPLYITFGDHTKAINIAEQSFCVMDNVKVLTTELRNRNVLRFIITSWLKNIPNLGYARHWSKAEIAKIYLPITLNGQPDWTYMESYMKKVIDKSEQAISALRAVV